MSQIGSPDRETFHLGMARLAYVAGAIDVEEFERSVAHVLDGGTLNANGRIGAYDELCSTVNERRRALPSSSTR